MPRERTNVKEAYQPRIQQTPNEMGHGDENGIDVTLIHWMLSMSPTQRLRTLQNAVKSLNRLRAAKIRS